MNKVVIFTDSCVDLGSDTIQKLKVEVVPLLVNIGEKVFYDGVDITPQDIIDSVAKGGVFPKTAAAAPATFIERFTPYIEQGYDIFYCGIGSTFSATLNSVLIARAEFPENRIFLVDSSNLSSAIGLLILKAVKYRDAGLSAKEIAEKVSEHVDRLRVQFVVDTLDFIYKGGRCSGATLFFAKHLKIHPILKVGDAKMNVYKKTRGPLVKAWNEMLSDFKKDLKNLDLDNVVIAGCGNEDGEKYMVEQLQKLIPAESIRVTKVGSVIATHCGPNTTGILYLTKK
ncbi:MAG: DegV family protein [Bacilli bacterium]